jgi:hypothetical protein
MYFHGKDEEMSLIQKTMIPGRSIIILPSKIVDVDDIKNCDLLEIIPLQQREILMKKTEADLVR